jgi:GNAT superfamily N-acetyltransferase
LLARQWNRSGLDRHVAWKAGASPDGETTTWVAIQKDTGAVVGSYFVVARTFNFAGRRIRYGLPSDNVVAPEYRGRGLWARLVQEVRDDVFRGPTKFLLGCPNAAALPPNLRQGINTPLLRLPGYYRRLSPRFRIGGVPFLGARRRWSIVELEAPPTDEDPFWEEIASERWLAPQKDGRYLRWRYAPDASPGNPVHWVSCWRGETLGALAVVLGRGSTACVAELLLSRRDLALAQWFAERLADRTRCWGYRHLVFYGIDGDFFDHAFRDYTAIREKSPLVVATLPPQNEWLAAYLRSCAVVYTAGDFDFL